MKNQFEFLEIFFWIYCLCGAWKCRRQPCRNIKHGDHVVSRPISLVAARGTGCADVLNYNVFIVLSSEFAMTHIISNFIKAFKEIKYI